MLYLTRKHKRTLMLVDLLSDPLHARKLNNLQGFTASSNDKSLGSARKQRFLDVDVGDSAVAGPTRLKLGPGSSFWKNLSTGEGNRGRSLLDSARTTSITPTPHLPLRFKSSPREIFSSRVKSLNMMSNQLPQPSLRRKYASRCPRR